jgi:hypothetical protein
MTRFRSYFAALATVLGVAGALPAATTWAAPSTPRTLTYEFTGCTGPAGTPVAFDAVKQPGEAAALHLVDGPGIFIAMAATDVETGNLLFMTPGFEHNELPTVTCSVINPRNGRLQLVTGLIVPVG